MPGRPSLRSIEIFVAAGRALSFTGAAESVGLTVSAVSRRVAALERELGTSLFRRYNRRIELTQAGARYLARMGEALAVIDRATAALKGRDGRKRIKLSVLQSFAAAWLMPRLAAFRAARPDIEVELETDSAMVDFAVSDVDAGIRFGIGPWPGLVAHKLLDIASYPVCAPQLAPRRAVSVRLLDRHPLLALSQVPQSWDEWCAAVGLAGHKPKRVEVFDNANILYEAAAGGMGYALCLELLARPHLDAGRLVSAFTNPPVAGARSYQLVHRVKDGSWPAMRALVGTLTA